MASVDPAPEVAVNNLMNREGDAVDAAKNDYKVAVAITDITEN
jgi:hypothetical protein